MRRLPKLDHLQYGMLLHTVLGEYDKAESMYQSVVQVCIAAFEYAVALSAYAIRRN
jgi:hypothetical protein